MEWISVKNHLPDSYKKDVLIYSPSCGVNIGFAIDDSCCPFLCYDSDYDAYSITHWMPLPEPPESED